MQGKTQAIVRIFLQDTENEKRTKQRFNIFICRKEKFLNLVKVTEIFFGATIA